MCEHPTHLVYGVDQDGRSIGKVSHGVNPHTAVLDTGRYVHTHPQNQTNTVSFAIGYLGQDSQQQSGVGDHLTDAARIAGDCWHYVWDEVRDSGGRGDEGDEGSRARALQEGVDRDGDR